MLFPSFCRILQKAGFRLKVSYLSFLKLYPLAKIKTNFIFVFEIYPLYLRHCLDAEANQRVPLPQELQWKGFNRKSRSSRLLVKLTLCLSLSHIRKYISHCHTEILSFLQKAHSDELYCSREFLHEVITSAKSEIQWTHWSSLAVADLYQKHCMCFCSHTQTLLTHLHKTDLQHPKNSAHRAPEQHFLKAHQTPDLFFKLPVAITVLNCPLPNEKILW